MRYQPTRESFIPANSRPIDCGNTDAAVYIYEAERNGKVVPLAVAFHGKAAKPDWHFRFTNDEQRQKRIAEHIEGRKARAGMMAELKAKRQAPHTLKIGDILVCTWGYDQTNVDFYQVTRVPGPMSVEIRAIAAPSAGGEGFMCDKATAARGHFTGEPMIKRCSAGNQVRIASYACAYPWDGKAHYRSWYA